MQTDKVSQPAECLRALTGKPPRKRFAGASQEEFRAWRENFTPWLAGVFAAYEGRPFDAEAAPDVKTSAPQDWHGECRRIEVRFEEAEYGLTIPATILEPPAAKRSGAGLICQHGHGPFGRLAVIGDRSSPEKVKEIAHYQYDFGLGLAQAGYVVLAMDLFNFGERRAEVPRPRESCDMVGLFLSAFGRNSVALQTREIRGAITVLSRWPGVDPGRLGMCGLSQGGRMTMFVSALDERIRAVVSSGAANTFRDRVALLKGLCGAQIVPGLALQADTPDIFASIAPRPLQLQWGSRDPVMDAAAGEAAIAHIQRCYAAAGARERLSVHRFEGGHVFELDAARRHFDRWLGGTPSA